MMIELSMGQDFKELAAQSTAMGRNVKKAASAGLGKAVKHASGHVITNYLRGQYLARRSGRLAAAVDGWLASDFDGVVGVRKDSAVDRYKYQLGDESVIIKPKNGKFLAIPIGENLTSSGVAKNDSPRDIEDGFFIRTGDRLLFGRKNGKRGKFRAMFTLVKQVEVIGTGALFDGVDESIEPMTDIITDQINKDVIDG